MNTATNLHTVSPHTTPLHTHTHREYGTVLCRMCTPGVSVHVHVHVLDEVCMADWWSSPWHAPS